MWAVAPRQARRLERRCAAGEDQLAGSVPSPPCPAAERRTTFCAGPRTSRIRWRTIIHDLTALGYFLPALPGLRLQHSSPSIEPECESHELATEHAVEPGPGFGTSRGAGFDVGNSGGAVGPQ